MRLICDAIPPEQLKKIMLDQVFDQYRVERLAPGLKSQNQCFPDDITVFQVGVDSAKIALDIFRVIHLTQMFPNDGPSVFQVKDKKIRMDCPEAGKIDFTFKQIGNLVSV